MNRVTVIVCALVVGCGLFWFAVLGGTQDNRLTPQQQVQSWLRLVTSTPR